MVIVTFDAVVDVAAGIADEAESLGIRVDRIIRYGSRSRGGGRPDSDVDLLLIIDRPLDFHADPDDDRFNAVVGQLAALQVDEQRRLEAAADRALPPPPAWPEHKRFIELLGIYAAETESPLPGTPARDGAIRAALDHGRVVWPPDPCR